MFKCEPWWLKAVLLCMKLNEAFFIFFPTVTYANGQERDDSGQRFTHRTQKHTEASYSTQREDRLLLEVREPFPAERQSPALIRAASSLRAVCIFWLATVRFRILKMDRATKSGIAAEAEAKIKSKFSPEQAGQLLAWIREVSEQEIDTDGSMENFTAVLKDGVVLCKLANALQPGAIRKINESKMAFKQMENINNFLNFAETVVAIPKCESFMTVDLYEAQDPNSVLICLSSVARKAHKFGKPSLGPKEAQGEKREWTDEQMRAGSNIISLQYGSNKGATQSGMNIGNSRHIILNQ